jgi:hypothetical protein
MFDIGINKINYLGFGACVAVGRGMTKLPFGSLLIAEDEEGHYEPVGIVDSFAEAQQMASIDMLTRLQRLDCDADPGLCPYLYQVWIRGQHRYELVKNDLFPFMPMPNSF